MGIVDWNDVRGGAQSEMSPHYDQHDEQMPPEPFDEDVWSEPHASVSSASLSHPDLGLRWEKRRITFNVILLAETILILSPFLLRRPPDLHLELLLFRLVLLCLVANVCFCAGPVADGYLHRMGLGSDGVSLILFTFGTLFAMALALGHIFAMLIHGID